MPCNSMLLYAAMASFLLLCVTGSVRAQVPSTYLEGQAVNGCPSSGSDTWSDAGTVGGAGTSWPVVIQTWTTPNTQIIGIQIIYNVSQNTVAGPIHGNTCNGNSCSFQSLSLKAGTNITVVSGYGDVNSGAIYTLTITYAGSTAGTYSFGLPAGQRGTPGGTTQIANTAVGFFTGCVSSVGSVLQSITPYVYYIGAQGSKQEFDE